MNRKDIFVIGFPRSGNTWVSRLLGDALNSPVQKRGKGKAIADEGKNRPGKYIIHQEHSDPNQVEEDDLVVLVVRDPRDVSVSVMHYWGLEDIEKATHCTIYGKWPTPHGSGWAYLYNWWQKEKEKYNYLIHYESLHKDTTGELQKMLEALDINNANPIDKVIARQSFETRKKKAKLHGHRMPYGYAIQNKALRKGIVGDWRNCFNNDLIEKICHAHPHDLSFRDIAWEYGYDVCSN